MSTVSTSSILLSSTKQLIVHNEYHTSLGEMPADDIISIAKHFFEIELIDTGADFASATWHETKALLNYLSHRHNVINFSTEPPATFTNTKNSHNQNPTLWVFGCSHSHGSGLDSTDQRFGAIVSKTLGLPATFFTRPGSSLQWSLRHLINTNFGSGDTVIWQITTPQRLTLYNNKPEEIMLANTQNRCLLDVFNDQQIFFHHCSLINYGVRYLRSTKTKFVMLSVLNKQSMFYRYIDEYTKYPEYCYMPNVNFDLGNDHLHPGPLSHQAIANHLVDHIQYRDA